MKSNYDKLRDLLKELFQLDQADLDFGIYRIMNQKRDDITRFLESDLLPQVQEAFNEFRSVDRAGIKQKLEETIQNIIDAGFDPEQSPKVKGLREKLAGCGVDATTLENEVFSDLYNFFRRYYQEGDFLSLRRYKEGVYAIPYEGEEVKLYWANHDQYYIKTSEYFRDYSFKLSSGKRVHFKLIEADTEKDNTKAQNGKERRFILCKEEPMVEANEEFFIRFEYRSDPDKRAQKDLNVQAIDTILKAKGFIEWRAELARLCPSPTNPKRTVLEKRLNDYTARNTFDYFIHKDLGKFLRRELDFYIKNEVMYLDDIENESVPRVEQYLNKIKVIRRLAHKLIDFLAQIENFQKKLWLKKKFVVETNYCVTLGRVPEELYPEIAANDAQREEWVRLFAIDEIKGAITVPDYSVPLTVEFLKANPNLVVDTKFFGEEFKSKMLANFNNLDTELSGLLVHSENFQALNLLQKKFIEQIRCIYIDPPYNTGNGEFIYCDSYRHSSWLSMMQHRLILAWDLLSADGVMFASIDDNELARFQLLLGEVFNSDNEVANVIWQKVFAPKNTAQHFSDDHEYLVVWAKSKNEWRPQLLPRSEGARARYKNPDNDSRGLWSSSDLTARNYYSEGLYEVISPGGSKFKPTIGTYWRVSKENFERLNKEGRIWWGADENNMPRLKRYLDEVKQGVVPQTLWTYKEVGHTQDAKREMLATVNFEHTGDVLNTVKPTGLIRRAITIGTHPKNNDWVLDFFGGSGTTVHAVLKQNEEDDGDRKFILIEMEGYFEKLTLQRVSRILYSTEWKSGKPTKRCQKNHIVKYIRLESYEDTLNNLELKRTKSQQLLLNDSPSFRESYMLSYMLDVESRGSASLLNIDFFEAPFNYKLNIANGSAGEIKPVTVDLVETFNYLLGLTVHHIDHIHGFRVVQGSSPEGEKVLAIWRNLKEKSNEDLDEFFRRQEYSPKDIEFDLIYVNGDNNLENIRRENETWKVRLIEEEFQRLMFDVEDI